jgi:hypothetical protein
MAADGCWVGANRPATQLRPRLKQKKCICLFVKLPDRCSVTIVSFAVFVGGFK